MPYHNIMKNKFCLYHLNFFLIIFLISIFSLSSCISETNIATLNSITSFTHKSELGGTFFNVMSDYDANSKNKSTNEITQSTLSEILKTIYPYADITTEEPSDTSFVINASDLKIDDLILVVNKNCTPDNKILYYDNNNMLHLNINVDNYFALSEIVPILNNETFYSYSAEYNKDISADEYKDLIAYAVSRPVSEALEKSLITISIKDQNGERNKTFSIIDFMLLHEPITL